MTPQPAEQNDFRAYLRAIWRWKWLMLAFLVVVPLISYALEARKTQEYQSSALVNPQAVQIDLSAFGGQQATGGQNILAIARLIKTTAVASQAAKLMPNGPPNGASLLGQVSVDPDTDTGFLTINATDVNPQRAAAIANAFGRAISENQANRARGQIDQFITRIQKQIGSLNKNDQATRDELTGQLQRLRSLRDAGRTSPRRSSSGPVRARRSGATRGGHSSSASSSRCCSGSAPWRLPRTATAASGLPTTSSP